MLYCRYFWQKEDALIRREGVADHLACVIFEQRQQRYDLGVGHHGEESETGI